MTFSDKTTILVKLLRHSFAELYEAFNFIKPELARLGKLRNTLAHCEIILPETPEPAETAAGVTIKRYRAGKLETERIPAALVNTQVGVCRILHASLVFINLVVRQAARGSSHPEMIKDIMEYGREMREELAKNWSA